MYKKAVVRVQDLVEFVEYNGIGSSQASDAPVLDCGAPERSTGLAEALARALEAGQELVVVQVAGDLEEFERQFPRRVVVQGKRASRAAVLADIYAMLERY